MKFKGEWLVTADNLMVVQVDDTGVSTVCEMNDCVEGFEGYARLIALAPKLLEALKEAQEALSTHWFSECGCRNNDDIIEADEKCQQVINLIEGRK